jgi:hypothetical protein
LFYAILEFAYNVAFWHADCNKKGKHARPFGEKMLPFQTALEDLVSEPVIGWLCAQVLYSCQPILTAFWGEEQISRWANRLAGTEPESAESRAANDTR